MNNGTMRYVNLGAGWMKKSKKDGSEFISLKVGDQKVKVWVQEEGKEAVEVTSLALFQNTQKKQDNHPDFRLTLTLTE